MKRSTQFSVGAVVRIVRSVLEDERNPILATVTLGWFLHLGIRLAFPALVPYFRAEFGLSLTAAGLLITLLWLTYALGQIPGGLLGDRMGERNTLALSTVLILLMTVFLALSVTEWWLFIGIGGLGLTTGLFATTRFTVLTDTYPERSGTVLGFSSGFGNLGAMVMPVVAVFIADAAGWRLGVGYTVPLFLAVAIGLWVTVPGRTSASLGSSRGLTTRIRSSLDDLLRPSVLTMVGAMFCMNLVYQSFTGFFPTYLIAIKGLTEQTASVLYGLFFGCALVVQPLVGAVSDRIGRRVTIIATSGVTMIALFALPFASGLVYLVVLTLFLGVQTGFWPAAYATIIEQFSDENQGGTFGIARTVFMVLGSAGPVVTGSVADAGYFDEVFFLLSAVTGVAGLVVAATIARG